MANDKVTIVLDGSISLDDFAEVIQGFGRLVAALTTEIGDATEVEWLLADLKVGSAVATARGVSSEERKVVSIVRGYEVVGKALSSNSPIPYSDKVRRPARAITRVLHNGVSAIRFLTDENTYEITRGSLQAEARLLEAYDAIRGRVQKLSRHKGLTFSLYDGVHTWGITCYLEKGQEDQMRDLWGKRAIVEGRVLRQPNTGRPVEIRDITHIVPLPEEPVGFETIRAIDRPLAGMSDGVEAIRRYRDAF